MLAARRIAVAERTLMQLAAVVVLGISAQWLAWRIRLPSILLLLFLGFLSGPVTGLIEPDVLFGELLFPLVSISVALILYEGGLTLRLRDLPAIGGVVRNLVTVGALLTWGMAALAAHWVLGLRPGVAVLLGAILVVTGPTVIGPMLRHIRPTGPVNPALMWEGIVIDPIGALLAVLVFEVLLAGGLQAAWGHVLRAVFKTVLVGGGLGVLAALLLAGLLHRRWIPDFLQNAVSLMLVVGSFAAANAIQSESGLLGVTVMGIALANQKWTDVQDIAEFKENLRVLLISCLFILLSARLRLEDLIQVGWGGAVFIAVLVVVARPVAVAVCTFGSRLKLRERVFLAWMAPRGIVAAAVSSLFALRLEETALVATGEARLLVSATFCAIVGTVAVYGLTAPWVARRLGVAVPDPQGVLFVGAPAWTRAVAELLYKRGFPVLLVDTNRENTAAARMAGLPVYTGSVLAEHALDALNLGGLGRLLAVTPNEWVNVLAVQRFERVFGRGDCYQLPSHREARHNRESHRHLGGRPLFAKDVTYASLVQSFATGSLVKATKLSAEFNYEAFQTRYGEDAVLLFVITASGKLQVVTAQARATPAPGQTVVALVPQDKA